MAHESEKLFHKWSHIDLKFVVVILAIDQSLVKV